MALNLRDPLREKDYDYLFENAPDKPCIENVFYWSLKASILGAGLGCMNALLIYKPPTYALGAQRVAFYTLPITGMGATVGATACILTNLRKKDDHWNYFIGGLAAGGIWGRMFNCPIKGLRMGILLGVFFGAKKFSVMQGVSWDPAKCVDPMKGFENAKDYDYSLIKDPGPSVRRVYDGLR